MIPRWPYLAAGFIIANSIQAFNILDRIVYGKWVGSGDLITQGVNVLMIALSLALFGKGLRRLRSIRTGAVLTLGLAVFLLSSVVWSGNPQRTISQGIVYLSVVIGAIGIASSLEADEFMKLLALICGLAALCSLFLAVVSPSEAFTGGDFRGIFSHKNVVGEATAMGALASLHGLRASRQQKWRNRLILVLVTIVCFWSKSMTSLSTIFVFCSAYTVAAMIRKGGLARILGIMGGFIAVLFLTLVVIFPDWVLEITGKDPTLTGRTEIWNYVIYFIYQKPLLGWGYNAFWFMGNPAAIEIDDAMHYVVPQAHNGLLEILLHVGMIGAVFFLFLLVRNIMLGLRCLRTSEKALAISSLLCCVGIILVGISEIVLLAGLEASTAVFFVTGFYCERALWLRQRRPAAAKRFAYPYAEPRQVTTFRAAGEHRERIGQR
jgi:exopolysaccharide production protein ExoQ